MAAMNETPVVTCKVTECSYNENQECFAPDIQVGDQHPQCDTFTTSGDSRQQEEVNGRWSSRRDARP